ncbi:putative secologanin synthase [Helianthus annuus]|nr:putative secologanin synthase [Helianthus annuus]
MEITTVSCVVGVASISIFLYFIWRILNWLWFKPKKIEKFLNDQGLKGTPYKILYGDLKEMVQMMNEAKSKPMTLTHDIAPRASPFFHKSLTTLGKTCFTWVGTRPLVHISEPAMIREVLVNYNTYQKPRGGNPLTKLLVRGLVDLEGEQWVKHRKIINPAFHMEKLKVTFLQFVFLFSFFFFFFVTRSFTLNLSCPKNHYMDVHNSFAAYDTSLLCEL